MNDDLHPAGAPTPGTPEPPPAPELPEPEAAFEPVASHDDLDADDVEIEPQPVEPAPAGVAPVRTQNRIALAGTLVIVLALVAGGAFLLGRGSSEGPAGAGATATPGVTPGPSAPLPTAVATDPVDGLPSDGSRLGRADAAVIVEYWADYQCPYCATFGLERMPELFPLIENGTVALVHRDFAFIGPESFDAAVAVRCAGREGRYWAMHDAVYRAQDGENQGAFARDRLAAIGASVGIDAATMQACFEDRSLLVDVLDDTSAGVRTSVQSTPTIDINGNRILGVPNPGEMEQLVAEAVAGASPAPLPTQSPISDPWAAIEARDRELGDTSAPVTVDLWMDYQSADSAVIARELAPELRTRITAGQARVVLHDLALLGDESVVAATMLRCTLAQDGPGFLVGDILSISARGPGAGIYDAPNLLRFGSQLGLDVRALDACMADPATALAVTGETAAGQAMGLAAGPSVVVSAAGKETGRFTGPIDIAAVLAAVDATE